MIKLNDKWHIDTDPKNFIVIEMHDVIDKKTGMPTGKKAKNINGYYPDMPRALKAIAKQESLDMIASGNMTLREAINRIEEIDRDTYDLFIEAGAD